MSKMVIYGKNTLQIFFTGTSWPISMKPVVKHLRFGPIIFCSNDNSGLPSTYFMARSKYCKLGFYIEKCDNGFFGNYCILWARIWFIVN